jgi:hypothetical protein
LPGNQALCVIVERCFWLVRAISLCAVGEVVGGILALLRNQIGLAAGTLAVAFQSAIHMADMDVLAVAPAKG